MPTKILDKDVARLIQLWNANLSEDIALEMGRSFHNIPQQD